MDLSSFLLKTCIIRKDLRGDFGLGLVHKQAKTCIIRMDLRGDFGLGLVYKKAKVLGQGHGP